MFICTHMSEPWHTCGGRRITFKSHVSPLTVWAPQGCQKSSVSGFTHWAITPIAKDIFVMCYWWPHVVTRRSEPSTEYLQYTQLLLSSYEKYGKCTRVAKWTVTGYFSTQMCSETGVKRGWHAHILQCVYTDLDDIVWPLPGSTSSLPWIWWSRWTKQHETALHPREKDAVRDRVCTKCHSELPFDK